MMVSGIVFGRPHLSFGSMNVRIPPVFKEPVGGVVVHCGVQAHVFNGNCQHMFFQFMESDKEADRIMPPCAGKTQEQRDVCPELFVMAGQLEQSVAKVIFFRSLSQPQIASGSGKCSMSSGASSL